MDFFEQIMNPNWKTVSREHKEVLAGSIIRYFINPLLQVENIRFTSFKYGGMKSDTFLVDIEGSTFVFIPGQKDVILGWDDGTNGLNYLEIADDRKEIYVSLEKCLRHWIQEWDFVDIDSSRSEISLSENNLDEIVNAKTSELRSVSIPSLLVEVQPSYVGMVKKGTYSVVSGVFDGDQEWFLPYKDKIDQTLFSSQPSPMQPFVEFPAYAYETNQYFIVQNNDLDHYTLYGTSPVSYQEARKEIEKTGMGLLSSNEWEYCSGGSTRRLFKWGNKIQRKMFEPEESVLAQTNMFGLFIANMGWGPELVEDDDLVKGGWMNTRSPNILEKLLPYSSYYVNKKDALKGKEKEEALRVIDTYVQMIRGEKLTPEQMKTLQDARVFESIKNLPARVKCATLSWHTMEHILEKQVK